MEHKYLYYIILHFHKLIKLKQISDLYYLFNLFIFLKNKINKKEINYQIGDWG